MFRVILERAASRLCHGALRGPEGRDRGDR
jgi:hypothetical protein